MTYRRTAFAAITGVLLVLAAPLGAARPDVRGADDDLEAHWHPAGDADGVTLEWRPSEVGQRAYRGGVDVCARLPELRAFVTDPSRLAEWIPFTEAASAVPAPPGERRYYLRTSAPWPFKARDMVYRLRPSETEHGVRLIVEGVPDAVPEREGAVRMRAAEGAWLLAPEDGRIRVTFQLAVDPGALPGFLVNRRLAATVAGTLANLAARFGCDSAG